MKILVLIARILLGLLFLVFGLNGFLNFIPTGPMPSGLAGQFVTVLLQSHYVLVISAIEVVGGALLLVNRYVPLGLTILGPIIVNIFLYHLLLFHMGVGIAIVVAILWGIIAYYHRKSFAGLFVQKSP
ncbi:MAG: DoxX family membrane protein [Candidatus Acidiferrales bacterium]|jgi:putative oxidoreductase